MLGIHRERCEHWKLSVWERQIGQKLENMEKEELTIMKIKYVIEQYGNQNILKTSKMKKTVKHVLFILPHSC